MPLALCRKVGRISSSNGSCHIDVEVLIEDEAGEPVWNMKDGIRRWMGDES